MIDVKNRGLSLHVGEEKLEFNFSKAMASPSLEDACYQVDVIDKVVFEEISSLNSPLDPIEACFLGTLEKRLKCSWEMKGKYMLIYLTWLHFFSFNTIQG